MITVDFLNEACDEILSRGKYKGGAGQECEGELRMELWTYWRNTCGSFKVSAHEFRMKSAHLCHFLQLVALIEEQKSPWVQPGTGFREVRLTQGCIMLLRFCRMAIMVHSSTGRTEANGERGSWLFIIHDLSQYFWLKANILLCSQFHH